ncbi:MAG: hypothetical protein J6S49_02240 [Erysipelotrichaceae bacterium]|nr:hypothetical protein [Erysipelotrichaceae bacterium]
MSNIKPFFVNSPRLAEQLALAGIELKSCQNIYDPKFRAWKCPLTAEAAEIIRGFYESKGKNVPDCVLSALSE